MIGEPPRTAYDLNFNLLGFPIRVHPAFFIMPLLFGSGMLKGGGNAGMGLIVLTVVFFCSILFHELGHSLAFRYYGIESYIVLYWFGGVAVPSGKSFRGGKPFGHIGQIVVALAGPIFNFILGGLLIGIVYGFGGKCAFAMGGIFPMVLPFLEETTFAENTAIRLFFISGFFANFVWGVLNLLPVYPLDGGQVARGVFQIFDPESGLRNSIIFSVFIAGLLAFYGIQKSEFFLVMFFGYMAYSNYQMLQFNGGRRW